MEPFKVNDWTYNAYTNEHYRECRTFWCKILGWMIPSLWDEWDERWLKDALSYNSQGGDILIYEKCIIIEHEGILQKAPFFYHRFVVAKDYQVHASIENEITRLFNRNTTDGLQGPVVVALFKDFDAYVGSYGGNDIPKDVVAEVPVVVLLMFPSMTKEFKPMPNLDAVARSHRWIQMHLWHPQFGSIDKFKGPCYTYCYKEPLQVYQSNRQPTHSPYFRDGGLSPDKYFPCGCKWAGQCETQFHKDAPMRRLFLSMYQLNINHPRISYCFQKAIHRVHRTDLLPMNTELFGGCRYALISLNGEYMFSIFHGMMGILRQTTGNPRFFQQICVQQDGRKQTLENCNRGNDFCRGASDGITNEYIGQLFQKGAQFSAVIPVTPYRFYKFSLLEDSLVAYGENNNDDRLVWHRNLNFPESPVLPLVLMLTNEGELVVLDGRGRRVRSGFPHFTGKGFYDRSDGEGHGSGPGTHPYDVDFLTRLINLKLQMKPTTWSGNGRDNDSNNGEPSYTDADSLVKSKCSPPFEIL